MLEVCHSGQFKVSSELLPVKKLLYLSVSFSLPPIFFLICVDKSTKKV